MATRTIANGGGNWTTAATWVEGVAPTAADDVVATATSGNITINSGAICRSADFTNYVATATHSTAITWTIGDATAGAGNIALKLVPGMTYTLGNTLTSAITFVSTSATVQTITTAGKLTGNITLNGLGGSWQLTDTHTMAAITGILTLTAGTFSTNGQTCFWGAIASNNSNVRTLDLTTSNINITGTSAVNFSTAANLTLSATSSSITLTDISNSTKILNSGNAGAKNWGNMSTTPGGTGGISFPGSTNNLFNTLTVHPGHRLIFKAARTYTVTTLNASGTFGNLVSIVSDITGTPAIISKSSGTVSLDYVLIKDSTASGGASWNAGSNSINVSGNTGWIFAIPVQRVGFLSFFN